MKIARLDLLRFGAFAGQSLDLSAGDRGLHVIHGPNEAGKSTTLRAVLDLLFGIPERTADGFRHNGPDLRIGARLVDDAGAAVDVIRKKGRKDTLLAADGRTPADDARLTAMLGAASRGVYESAFGLDHASLRSGGEELLRGEGDVGKALFGTSLGTGQLSAVQRGLDVELDRLWKKAGRNPRLNALLLEHRDATTALQAAIVAESVWRERDEACRLGAERAAAAQRARREHEQRLQRLERLQRTVGPAREWRELVTALAAFDDLPAVPDDFGAERERVDLRIAAATRDATKADTDCERLRAELARHRVSDEDRDLLDARDHFDALHQRFGAYRADREAVAAAPADGMAPPADPELALATIAELRRLADQHDALLTAHDDEQAELDAARQARDGLDRALAAAIDPGDVAALERALADAEPAARAAEDLVRERAALASDASDRAQRLASLGRWRGDAASLATAALPSLATVRAAVRAARDRDAAALRLTERRDAARERAARARRDLDALERSGEVPAADALENSRRRRDALWLTIRARWLDGRADAAEAGRGGEPRDAASADDAAGPSAAVSAGGDDHPSTPTDADGRGSSSATAFAGGRSDPRAIVFSGSDGELAAAHEDATHGADRIADLCRDRADAIARRAGLEADLAAAERELDDCARDAAAARELADRAAADWAALWAALPLATADAPGIPDATHDAVDDPNAAGASGRSAAPEGREAARDASRTSPAATAAAVTRVGAPGTPEEMEDWLQQAETLRTDLRDLGNRRSALDARAAEIDAARARLVPVLTAHAVAVDADAPLPALVRAARTAVERGRTAQQQRDKLATDREHADRQVASAAQRAGRAATKLDEWSAAWQRHATILHLDPDAAPALVRAELARLAGACETEQRRRSLAAFEAELARFVAAAAPSLAGRPTDEAFAELARRIRAASEATALCRSLDEQLTAAERDLRDAEAALAECSGARERLLRPVVALVTRDGAVDEPALDALVARLADRAALRAKRDTCEQKLRAADPGFALTDLLDEADGHAPDRVAAELLTAREAVEQFRAAEKTADAALVTARHAQAELDGRATAAELREQLERLSAEIADEARRLRTLTAARTLLAREIERYRGANQEPVLARARELFQRLSCGEFVDLETDVGARDAVHLLAVRGDGDGLRHPALAGRRVGVEGLSSGTRDQLFLALKLATIETMLTRRAVPRLPVVLDDVLVHFDDARSRAALEVFADLAATTQVLLFTHHAHIAALARAVDAELRPPAGVFVHDLAPRAADLAGSV